MSEIKLLVLGGKQLLVPEYPGRRCVNRQLRAARISRIGSPVRAITKPTVLSLLLVLLSSCAAAPTVETNTPEAVDVTSVFVVAQGWHTGIVLRRADVSVRLWPEIADFADATYVIVGWGDRDYYPAPRFNLWYGLKALFWPTASVLHVVGFVAPPADRFPHDEVVELRLTREAVERLSAHIGASFERHGGARARPLLPSPYGSGWFYPSRESFHLFKTCNVWIAQALRAAGLPIHPTFALTTASVMRQVRKFGRVIQPSAPAPVCRAAHG